MPMAKRSLAWTLLAEVSIGMFIAAIVIPFVDTNRFVGLLPVTLMVVGALLAARRNNKSRTNDELIQLRRVAFRLAVAGLICGPLIGLLMSGPHGQWLAPWRLGRVILGVVAGGAFAVAMVVEAFLLNARHERPFSNGPDSAG